MTRRLVPFVALGALVCGCGGAATGGAPAADEPAQPARPPLVQTDAGPVGLHADAAGRLWVANADAGTVTALTPDGAVEHTTPVGGAPLRVASADGSIWVTVFRDGSVARLNSKTGKVVSTIAVGQTPEGIVAAKGSLWVVLENPGQLARIDPKTEKVVKRYGVGSGPRLVTSGGGALFVSRYTDSRITRLDPATGQTLSSKPLCAGPQGMLVLGSTLWVACTLGDVLVGVDADTLTETSRLPLGGTPDAVVAGPDGTVLVALQKGPTLVVVDPAGPSIAHRYRLGKQDQLYDRANIDAVYADGTATVSSYLEGGVYRLPL